MNATHIHLLLNHFPIVGTLIGSCLLMWGIIKNQNNYKAIASFILLMMAIIAIPVYLTGEPAEESVEKLAGVSESIIEQHEDAAAFAIWLMIITGAAALIAMVSKWQKHRLTKIAYVSVFILSVLSFSSMALTGYYGGMIRHSEINSNASVQLQPGYENPVDESERDND